MKRKSDKIDGHDPWEIEVAYVVEHLKADLIDARAHVVINWMLRGNLRPLAAALRDGPLDPPVASQLAKMIDEGQLIVKHNVAHRRHLRSSLVIFLRRFLIRTRLRQARSRTKPAKKLLPNSA